MLTETVQKNIKTALINALASSGIQVTTVNLEHPADISHGEYSTNVALLFAKQNSLKPHDLAKNIVSFLEENKLEHISKIEIAGPGFINFHLSPDFYLESIREILALEERYGSSKVLFGKKILVEYTDPNPFKEFHIGHVMSNTIGEALSRIIAFSGAEVKRACYQGDVGIHVAKAIFGMLAMSSEFPNETAPLHEKTAFMGKAYALGAKAYEAEGKKEIQDLNKKIYERSDTKINKLYDVGKKWSLESFELMYKRLGTHFAFYFFESKAGPFGKEIVEKHIGTIFEKSDGAIIFKGEAHNASLHTRVFINKEGLPTYEAKELGLAKIKYETYPYDKSVVVTANEVNDYFRVLLKAMELVFPELRVKTEHVSHGMLRLPSGKMSSRTGDVILAHTLLSEIEKMAIEKIKDRGYSEELQKHIASRVSVGAVKYSILKQAIGGDIIFDLEKSISFDGDSGPYLEYSVARAVSLLEKGKEVGIKIETEMPKEWNITTLEKFLYRFPEVTERSLKELAPHYIVTYLTELASAFNTFYGEGKIVGKNDATASYKLSLVKSFVTVMTNGLTLLGISIPEKM